MRAFAEFVMRGPSQAVMVAVLGVGSLVFAWVSAGVIALVTLRKGAGKGAQIWIWAMLPALAVAVLGRDVGPMAAITGALLAAAVLRATASWPAALLMASVSGLVTGMLMLTVGLEQLQAILAVLKELVERMQQQSTTPLPMATPGERDVAALIGLSNAGSVVLSLLIGRWLQALLYNPGGFRKEMLELRLQPVLALVLVAVSVALPMLAPQWAVWSVTVTVPLLVAGVCLIHGLVDRAGLAVGWLWAFYVVWLFVDQFRMILVLLAGIDSVVNFRARVSAAQPSDKEDK